MIYVIVQTNLSWIVQINLWKIRIAVLDDSFSFYGPAYSFFQPIATKYEKNNDTFYQSTAFQ